MTLNKLGDNATATLELKRRHIGANFFSEMSCKKKYKIWLAMTHRAANQWG